ncbi:MJ0042-type zinc finger domain-containing protein [Luteitalea sp. TBR-22]|uniref:MJ0042-type zinc finger domain-containing protein n=1 Tax=Luteitalea sp. TBR-22 TaxID=2802971 RepID=UPI00351D87FC
MVPPSSSLPARDARQAFAASATDESLPTTCPSCASTRIVSAAKSPSAHGYWRCEPCGEIWSPDRRQSAAPHRSWRA